MALTQYDLSRQFWNFVFINPEKVKPTHIAIYFFAVEHCNRLGWKEKFGLPTTMVLEAIGLKSYNTYKDHFDDLVEWGAIKVVEYSKNQYSSNIISLSNALSKNNKALDNALSKKDKANVKALAKHTSKHLQSTGESTGSIDKQVTNNTDNILTAIAEGEDTTDLKTEIEKEKKLAPKKEKEPTEFWEAVVGVWFAFYHAKKETAPTFKGQEPHNLKEIIKNLKSKAIEKKWEWTEQTAKTSLLKFLEIAYNDEWLRNNFLLHNLLTKFDKIIADAQRPANTKTTAGNPKGHQEISGISLYNKLAKLNNET